jgi:putative ABC transport system permease protein
VLNLGISAELLLIPGLIVLAVIVGLLPAIAAYRTDVAKALGGS